jgi:hypothetical protein
MSANKKFSIGVVKKNDINIVVIEGEHGDVQDLADLVNKGKIKINGCDNVKVIDINKDEYEMCKNDILLLQGLIEKQ